MPIRARWHDAHPRVLLLQYAGALVTSDYMESVTTVNNLAQGTDDPIYLIVECLPGTRAIDSPLSTIFRINASIPANLEMIVVVQPTTYARMLLTIARSVAPRIVRDLHYAQSIAHALNIIQQHEPVGDVTDESDG